MNELVRLAAEWRKSTFSVTGECVEVGTGIQQFVAVRDNKDMTGPQLAFTAGDWREFVGRIKAGRPIEN